MKLKQRSQIAFASSVAIHVVLLLVLSILGAFSILDKKDKPVDVIFFDSVGGSGGSGGSAPKQQQTAAPIAQPAPTIDKDAIQDKNNTTQAAQSYTPAPVSGNQTTAGEGTGDGSGTFDRTFRVGRVLSHLPDTRSFTHQVQRFRCVPGQRQGERLLVVVNDPQELPERWEPVQAASYR